MADLSLKSFKSDSDNESVRHVGDVPSEDEINSDEEDEVFKTAAQMADKYFIVSTGASTSYVSGEQVFNSYGRLSNRNLLLDYGFTIPENKYDAVYFRMWNPKSGRTGLVSLEDYENCRGDEFELFAKLYALKLKRLNSEIFSYFRQILEPSAHQGLEHLSKPLLYATPYDIDMELCIAE